MAWTDFQDCDEQRAKQAEERTTTERSDELELHGGGSGVDI